MSSEQTTTTTIVADAAAVEPTAEQSLLTGLRLRASRLMAGVPPTDKLTLAVVEAMGATPAQLAGMEDAELTEWGVSIGWEVRSTAPAAAPTELPAPDPRDLIRDRIAAVKGTSTVLSAIQQAVAQALMAAPSDSSAAVMDAEAQRRSNIAPDDWVKMPEKFRAILAEEVKTELSKDGRFLSGVERAEFEMRKILSDLRLVESALQVPSGPTPSAPTPSAPALKPVDPIQPKMAAGEKVTKVLIAAKHREQVGQDKMVIGEHSYEGQSLWIGFDESGCTPLRRVGEKFEKAGATEPMWGGIFSAQRDAVKPGKNPPSAPATIKIWVRKENGKVVYMTLKDILALA